MIYPRDYGLPGSHYAPTPNHSGLCPTRHEGKRAHHRRQSGRKPYPGGSCWRPIRGRRAPTPEMVAKLARRAARFSPAPCVLTTVHAVR